MNFTPQQLTGGARFSKQVKIGNWSEDLEIEELKLKDYLKKKEGGELLVNTRARKLAGALAPAELGVGNGDKTLTFGTKVMLVNHKSEGFLAANPFEEIPKEETCTAATTTGIVTKPTVRNVFTIERASDKDGFGADDALVHYGQDFVLSLEPFADMTAKTYLHSEMISPLSTSKFSAKQEVLLCPAKSGKGLWQLQWPDVKQRFENDGMLVRTDVPLVLKHVHTGRCLASDKINYTNMFGNEYEIHAHNYVSTNKTQNLSSEAKGSITGDYQLRRTGLENIWSIVVGEAPASEEAAPAEAAEGA